MHRQQKSDQPESIAFFSMVGRQGFGPAARATAAALSRLARWHGHFYNWYDTARLCPLRPAYVSTVDSGNLAACLLTWLLPAAAPSIVTGMRLGLGVAWMCLVAAEMMPGSISGIGYVITHAYTVARTDIVVAGMISIGAMGLAIDAAFRRFEEKCFAWQRLSR